MRKGIVVALDTQGGGGKIKSTMDSDHEWRFDATGVSEGQRACLGDHVKFYLSTLPAADEMDGFGETLAINVAVISPREYERAMTPTVRVDYNRYDQEGHYDHDDER